jgi:Zn-dependent protease with chaperone function
MDFFARQDQARKKTKWLVFYFALAVISMTVMSYGVGLLAKYFVTLQTSRYSNHPDFVLWDWHFFGFTTFITLVVIGGGCAWKMMDLSGGGGALCESLGGELVQSNTTDPDERKLLNVVEEMSIASGVPMPQVYVLKYEDGINAFAAGHSTSDAAIAVTQNCMAKLSRDELQGVIGHEFSHILNGDMRLNLRLIGILFGIFCIATMGRILMQMRSSSSRDRNPLPLLGLLLLIIGSIGYFFGRLIQAAVSRQREFLADASSVQFTRNPAGLSGALQKVGGYTSLVTSPHASDAAHLFFGDVNGSSFAGVMATHPPLDQRIRAIDPNWDGKFQRLPDAKRDEIHQRETAPLRPRPVFENGRMVILGGVLADAEAAKPPVIHPNAVLPNLGNPTPLHLRYAEALRDALPENVKTAAHEPLAAAAMIFALLLSANETERATQLDGIGKNFSPEVADKTRALFPDVAPISTRARLPLVNISLGALRQLTPEQYRQFSRTLQWLVQSDGKVELFEFVLQKIIRHHLAPKFTSARPAVVQFYTLKPLVPDCAVVLSALADAGSGDAAAAQGAFAAGAPYLRAPAGMEPTLLPREQCAIEHLDAALDRLALAAPIIKKNLLEACARVVGADGVIQEAEAELLRAVADTLDCPMPPLGVAA